MHPGIFPALCTLCMSIAMAVQLSARRFKEPLHWLLIGFLCSLVLWSAGSLVRFSATTLEGLAVGVKLVLTGCLIASAFWVMAASVYDRARATPRPGLPVVVIAGTALLVLSLFTNEGHRLFLRKLDFASVEAGPVEFAGPLFWVFLAWSYGCVGSGMALYFRSARQMMRSDSRRRGFLLALAAAIPLFGSTLYVFQWVPVRFDLTPAALTVSMVMLWLAVFRYRLFESLPLARDAVIGLLDDGVVMASASGRITDWNAAARRILGSPLRPGDRLDETLARLRSGADERVVEVSCSVVDEQRGEPSGQFAIVSDRTEADRIEKLARQAQRLEIVGALASDFAHEINDPLSFVRSNLVEIERLGQRVDAEADGPDAALAAELDDLRAVALETLEGVDRMQRTVEGMRALAVGDLDELVPLDLGRVVRDAVHLAQMDVDRQDGPHLDLRLASAPRVRGNPDRLVQVVLNLLVNARQSLAGTPGARIEIDLRRAGAEVELVVRDNGPGIPDDVRDRIFDPFFTTRGPDEGTGLGLAIAFDIAREHGGVLEERSSESGACFALRLPTPGLDDTDLVGTAL